MAILVPDRVLQTTETAGSGAYALDSATQAFRNFSDQYANNAPVPYCATDNQFGYEIGVGTLVLGAGGSPDQIFRTSIVASSNLGGAVAWSGNTKQIFAWDVAGSEYTTTFIGTYGVVLGDWGTSFCFTNSSPGTFSLPALSTVPPGFSVTLKNSGTAAVSATPHSTDQIETYGASTAYSHSPGTFASYSSDGTVWRQDKAALGNLPTGGTSGQMLRKTSSSNYAAAWQDAPLPVAVFMPSVPASSAIARIIMTEAGTFAANFSGSEAKAKTASTGTATVTVNKNGSALGTVIFTTSATGSFATTGGAAQSFAAADIIEFSFPASPDATLADIAITLRGVRS